MSALPAWRSAAGSKFARDQEAAARAIVSRRMSSDKSVVIEFFSACAVSSTGDSPVSRG